jgi:parallel beta-helix repeat protein/YD repeat-containing protein
MPQSLKQIAVVIAALLQLLPHVASAATINVPLNIPTIQSAIDAAQDGDIVEVSPGTYYENIDFLGKAIEVRSRKGARPTIINGRASGSVVTFSSHERRSSILSGFVIRNGRSGFDTSGFGDGGGIRIDGASPTIRNNIIKENHACVGSGISISFGSPLIQGNRIINNSQSGCSGGIGGGGISIGGAASAMIIDNVIADNVTSSSDGGGISLFAAGSPTIRGNIIRGNRAYWSGGGISMFNQSDANIIQNLITGNSADNGGGIYWLVPSGVRGPFLVNNTIADNFGAGVFADGYDKDSLLINNLIVETGGYAALYCGDFNDTNAPVISSNDIFNPNHAAYDGTCSDRTGSDGNISADPLFVSAVNGNYHIGGQSPPVDAGDNTAPSLPAVDFDGARRIQDGNQDGVAQIDMGIDEQMPPAVTTDISQSADAAGIGTDDDAGEYRPPVADPQALFRGRTRDISSSGSITAFTYDSAGSLITRTDADGAKLNMPHGK